MAKLNLDFYSGNDEYTDGDVENEMLKIAMEETNIEDDIKNGELKFPILYHFSHIRENILNWYPFEANADVLEIGSGCGALTGLLCAKANRVTSIELSKLRATINYYRHKNYDNLDVVVGNFNDIILHDKFDYIVLNGALEYAISFTKCENPYVQFLNFVSGFLKEEGKILIAIENRLGLKYFAGASEDHTGNIFLGLNDYRNNNSVRTFSKGELIDILDKSNLKHYKFYYPYPDYKFPNEIFTDDTIDSGRYGKYYYSLDQSRMRIFDETKVANSLQKENVMGVFSNSFLVETCKKPTVSNDIIYAKLNNDRHCKFRIATVIQDDGQKREVYKKALNDDAIEHIISMKKKNDIYNGVDYFSLQGEDCCRDKITYPFIYEKSVDSMISNLIVEGNVEEIISILKSIYSTFFNSSQMSDDYHTSQFTEVFGVEKYLGSLPCIKPANIDLICDNIYYVDKKFIIIDCEWVFEFNIPCQFIIWRAINELYNKYTKLQELISESIILEHFIIDEGLSSVFREWANYFAREYVGSFRLEKSSKQDILINIDDIYHQILQEKKLISKVYYNQGRGFNEEDIIVSNVELKDDNFEIEFSFDLINNISGLRWDPVEQKPCKCIISSIESNVDLKMWPINAFENDDLNSTFISLDPQYLIEGNISQIKYMKIYGKIVFLDIKDIVTEFNVIRDKNMLDKNKCEQLQIEINSYNIQLKKLANLIEQKENDRKEMEEILRLELNSIEEELRAELKSKEELLTEMKLIQQETLNSNDKLAAIYNSRSWKILCKLSIFKSTIMKLKNISKKRANDE